MGVARRVLGTGIAVITLFAVGSCGPAAPSPSPQILLFAGTGTSPSDVRAIEGILRGKSLAYAKVDSAQLNRMGKVRLMAYRLFIVPGGNYIEMGGGLEPTAVAEVREAVRGGMNYLGICAGALLAGRAPTNSFDLTSGVRFDFYGVVNQGVHKAAVPIASPGGAPALDQYWEDGPQLAGWGAAVAKYPDGTPAVAQGACGKGWVVLCGFHPEAPEGWRKGMTFRTPAGEDHGYAGMLVEAALEGRALPQFEEKVAG